MHDVVIKSVLPFLDLSFHPFPPVCQTQITSISNHSVKPVILNNILLYNISANCDAVGRCKTIDIDQMKRNERGENALQADKNIYFYKIKKKKHGALPFKNQKSILDFSRRGGGREA